MQHEMSRRDLIKRTLLASTFVPAFGLITRESNAADLTPLDSNDPTAKALAFVADAAHVDASRQSQLQDGPALRELYAVPGQASRCDGRLHHLSRTLCAGGWLVQSLGAAPGLRSRWRRDGTNGAS